MFQDSRILEIKVQRGPSLSWMKWLEKEMKENNFNKQREEDIFGSNHSLLRQSQLQHWK